MTRSSTVRGRLLRISIELMMQQPWEPHQESRYTKNRNRITHGSFLTIVDEIVITLHPLRPIPPLQIHRLFNTIRVRSKSDKIDVER